MPPQGCFVVNISLNVVLEGIPVSEDIRILVSKLF
jgi:hypothetical protein